MKVEYVYNYIFKCFKSGEFWIICFILCSILLSLFLLHQQYKKRIIISWIIGIGITCFALYSSISYVALHPNDNGNYISLFTGWLGGVFTAILGCMAVVQSRTYNTENNDFLTRQEEIQQNMVNENRKQTKKFIEYKNNIDLRQSIDRLVEDIKLFIIEIDFLSLLQSIGTEGYTGEELYLRCLQCEMKISMLQKRMNAYSVYIVSKDGKKKRIGTRQQKELGIALNELLEKLTHYISEYLEKSINLERNMELHKVELTQLCFDIAKKYYSFLDILHESFTTLNTSAAISEDDDRYV